MVRPQIAQWCRAAFFSKVHGISSRILRPGNGVKLMAYLEEDAISARLHTSNPGGRLIKRLQK